MPQLSALWPYQQHNLASVGLTHPRHHLRSSFMANATPRHGLKFGVSQVRAKTIEFHFLPTEEHMFELIAKGREMEAQV